LALSTRYGLGPKGLGVEPKPSVAIHTIRSQRWVVAGGTRERLPFPGDPGRRGRGPPGQPGSRTGAVLTLTG
jgi:hypothetical protein